MVKQGLERDSWASVLARIVIVFLVIIGFMEVDGDPWSLLIVQGLK